MNTLTDDQLDIIAVGAHPDDVEIACGGTLARLAQLGYKIGIVDLTDGEPTPGSPSPEVRLVEAGDAAETLGIQKRIQLNLPNRRLFDNFESRVALAKEFRRFRPSIVMGLGGKTPMASPDHWQAMQITDAAVFYSRLTKWDDKFEDLPVHSISKQLYYQLVFEPIDNGATGHFIMDISETLEIKLASIRCYKTQFPPEKEYVFDRVRGHALQCGGMAGYEAGEIFVPARSLGTQDLVKLLG